MFHLQDELARQTAAFNNVFRDAAYIARQTAQFNALFRQAEDFARQTTEFRRRRARRNERLKEFQNQSPETSVRCPDQDCRGRLILSAIDEPECLSEIAGIGYDLRCTGCKLIIYLPPMISLKRQADQYYSAALTLRESERYRQLTDPAIFLAHQSAETYLKSLGTCTLYPGSDSNKEGQLDDREWVAGPGLECRNHDLERLLGSVYQFIRHRLEKYGESDNEPGCSIGELVQSVPAKTSEYYRYGVLKGTTYDGVEDEKLTTILLRLCKLLKRFATEEADW